jgi:hypothetical protein
LSCHPVCNQNARITPLGLQRNTAGGGREGEGALDLCPGGIVPRIEQAYDLVLHYAFDMWMRRTFPECPFERYADGCAPRRREGRPYVAVA